MYKKYDFSQFFLSELLIYYEYLSESLMVDHLSWGTWVIHSLSLAHIRSFVLSDLSKSLTVAHLIWAIWANEQMHKFPALVLSRTYLWVLPFSHLNTCIMNSHPTLHEVMLNFQQLMIW